MAMELAMIGDLAIKYTSYNYIHTAIGVNNLQNMEIKTMKCKNTK